MLKNATLLFVQLKQIMSSGLFLFRTYSLDIQCYSMDKGLDHCKTSSEQDNTTQKTRGHPSMPCMRFKPTIPVRHHIPNAMCPLWSTKQNTKFHTH